MQKMLAIVLLILFLKTKKFFDCFDLIYLAKNLAKYFKIQPLSSKIAEIRSFSLLWLNLPKVHS